METRAQGNTFWIIITAVIALVILVILLLIFTGKTGKLEMGLIDCQSKGGFCISCDPATQNCNNECGIQCTPKGYNDCAYSSAFSCTPAGEVCCLGTKIQK